MQLPTKLVLLSQTKLIGKASTFCRLHFDSRHPSHFASWSTGRKWNITCCASFLVLNGNFASALPSGSLTSISEDFGVSEVIAALTTTLFLLGYCVGPFIFAPLSEFYGRQWIFYVTFRSYLAFSFLCAFAPSFSGLLAGRFLAGTFASASLTNVPGALADIWDPTERGNAMAIFSLVVWTGPSLGPIVAGFLEMSKGWRWGFYVVIWLGAVGIVLMFTLPETHAPTILTRKAHMARQSNISTCKNVQSAAEANTPSLTGMYKKALTLPWILLFDTISFLCALYMFFVYTLQYMLFSIYPIVFQDIRGWNAGVGQLPLLGTVVQ
ncbi:hypothetical protein QWA68_015729 [Fusarium oxysporum]|nr:hypothetical protein QWA68_015729 [Fusarium oxysporum]